MFTPLVCVKFLKHGISFAVKLTSTSNLKRARINLDSNLTTLAQGRKFRKKKKKLKFKVSSGRVDPNKAPFITLSPALRKVLITP